MKKEIKPSDTVAIILAVLAVLSLIVLAAGVFVSKQPLKFAPGLAFGVIISAIRLLMLARAVNISVDMEPAESKTYMLGQYNLRMLLTVAAVFAGGMMREYISIFALIAGLIILQPSVYIANFIYEKMGGEKIDGVSTKKTHRHS